jgi:hypothetical protein
MVKRVIFALLLLLIGIRVLYAQTPNNESPAAGIFEEWSADSQNFVYENVNKRPSHLTLTPNEVFKSYPAWESFNPDTGNWFENTVWPLYPDLTEAEKAVFQTEGFIRTSPDGEILIYPSTAQKLTIANRTTQQVFETDIDYPSDNIISYRSGGQKTVRVLQ